MRSENRIQDFMNWLIDGLRLAVQRFFA